VYPGERLTAQVWRGGEEGRLRVQLVVEQEEGGPRVVFADGEAQVDRVCW
jgi:hypothetical protein